MCQLPRLDRFERAALLVRNAMHGRRVAPPTPRSILAQLIYHNRWYRWTYTLCLIAWLSLAVWEPPAVVTLTPGVLWLVRAADVACMAIVAADTTLQLVYHGVAEWRSRGWVRLKIAVIVVMATNLGVHVIWPGRVPYILRALRPILVIERLRNVRRIAGKVAATLPKMVNVLILVVLHMLFFTVLGFVLFAGIDGVTNCTPVRASNPVECSTFSDTCSDYFASLDNSFMQLFELLTAANFPTVAYPAYSCNRASMLFFLVYVVIGAWLRARARALGRTNGCHRVVIHRG